MHIMPWKKLLVASLSLASVLALLLQIQSSLLNADSTYLVTEWLTKRAAGNAELSPVHAAGTYQSSSILWSANHETGDISQWEARQGRAIFNSNTAPGTSNISVSTDVARSGQYALKLSLTGASTGQTQGARIFRRWLDNDVPPSVPLPDEAYYSAWYYFPQVYSPDQWWNIFQFKSRRNQSQPMLALNLAKGRSGDMYLYVWNNMLDESYGQDDGAIPVPIGRWVHIEAYIRVRDTETGQLTIWQDGTQILDLANIRTLANPGDRLQWSINNYTDGITPDNPAIYVDDAAISTTRIGSQVSPNNAQIYLSSNRGGVIDGVNYGDEDILRYDMSTDNWSMFFNGSYLGMRSDLEGFHIEPDGSILMSLDADRTLPGISGNVARGDIVRFIPTATGENSTGRFEMFLDRSDVGLAADSERIDAIGRTPDGKLVVSTVGNYSLASGSGGHEDLLVFDANSVGADSSGTFARYLDGSDLDLTTDDENVSSVWVDPATEQVHMSTYGDFETRSSFTGDADDIFTCAPDSLGSNTVCTLSRFWNGEYHGFSGERIDGLSLVSGASSLTVAEPGATVASEPGPSGRMPRDTLGDNADGDPVRQLYLPDIRR